MLKFLKNFRDDESGAVTVDYIVLTAGVVLLAVVVFAFLRDSTTGLATSIGDRVNQVNTNFNTPPAD
ncbi:hypothetical protein [Pseudaestuariivita rosea]|uniref:hypothetical protein n=1 Tax=Pseudaestuariivita rosea TaxID=2763263 RepID=UPI001ABBAD3F|nr:hypothetical protein [Pseudaestuariivita rosea]